MPPEAAQGVQRRRIEEFRGESAREVIDEVQHYLAQLEDDAEPVASMNGYPVPGGWKMSVEHVSREAAG